MEVPESLKTDKKGQDFENATCKLPNRLKKLQLNLL